MNTNGYYCSNCGQWVNANCSHICYMPVTTQPYIPPPYTTYQPAPVKRGCEHCWCKDLVVNKQPHVKCCNCGVKKRKY